MLETAALLWGLTDAASPGELQAKGPSFAVTYRAAPDCPTQAQFEAAIVARAPGARSSNGPNAAEVHFEAELSPEPGQKRRLRVALDDGSSQDREIEADDCVEAVQSMAVIAAMILSSRPAAPAPEIKPEPQPEPGPQPEPEPQPEPVPPPAPVPVSVQPARTVEAPVPPPRNARPTWLAVSAGAGLEGAAAPSPAFAASASSELGSVTSGVLAPSVRLSLLFGQALDATTDVGSARFQLALARAHACGLRFGRLDVELRLCAVVEGGALLARGINARNERSYTMPWLGAGLGAIGGLGLSARWSVELAGSARAPLVRDKFIFAPGTPVYQPAVIAWDFRLGLAYRLW